MKEKNLDKKTAVFGATLELISEQGFHGAPMSQIAERANIGVGTIYRYFASKDELINALYIDIKTKLARYILQKHSENLSVEEGFENIFKNLIYYFIEHPAELSFVEQYENSPMITEATHQQVMQIAWPWKYLFERAIKESLLKELPIEIMSAILYGAIISMAKLYLAGTVKIEESSLAMSIAAVWDMVRR